MEGRTYRYFRGEPLYPFGHGLSYTSFEYGHLLVSPRRAAAGERIDVSLRVTNTGPVAGDEVVQLYVRDEYIGCPRPVKELKGFARVALQPGESKTVTSSCRWTNWRSTTAARACRCIRARSR